MSKDIQSHYIKVKVLLILPDLDLGTIVSVNRTVTSVTAIFPVRN